MRLRRAAQKDTNHNEIVAALTIAGVRVVELHRIGGGVPDLLCGYKGLTVLMEVKMPQSAFVKGGAEGKRMRRPDEYDPQFGFTDDERRFHASWTGQPIVTVRSAVDALAAFGLMEQERA